MSAPLQEVYTNLYLWSGKRSFRHVETCYVGMMAVDKIGQEVKLYSHKNCFFSHEIAQDAANLFYGFVDVPNRCIRFVGQPNQDFWEWADKPRLDNTFSVQDYLDCVLDGQQVQIVERPEDADVVLTMARTSMKTASAL